MRKPITRKEWNRLWSFVRGIADLAMHHDPEHEDRLNIIERQLEKLNAPQYRTVRSSRGSRRVGIYAQRVRGVRV
jgi:hypothetical protein